MKKYLLPLLVCAPIVGNVCAEELPKLPFTFQGNVGVYSDYRFRGLSQTQEDPALQADITATHESGFKLSLWGSNADFNNTRSGSAEVDITAAYQRQLMEKLTGEAGVIYYWYPGSDGDLNYDYVEGYGLLAYDFGAASVNASLNVSPEFFGESGTAFYPHVGVQVPLPHNFTAEAGIGRQYIENEAVYGVPDYTEWMLGMRYSFYGNKVSLKYQDTDMSDNRCAVGCGATAVLGISRQF